MAILRSPLNTDSGARIWVRAHIRVGYETDWACGESHELKEITRYKPTPNRFLSLCFSLCKHHSRFYECCCIDGSLSLLSNKPLFWSTLSLITINLSSGKNHLPQSSPSNQRISVGTKAPIPNNWRHWRDSTGDYSKMSGDVHLPQPRQFRQRIGPCAAQLWSYFRDKLPEVAGWRMNPLDRQWICRCRTNCKKGCHVPILSKKLYSLILD